MTACRVRSIQWSESPDGWLHGVKQLESPNFNARPAGMVVDTLVMHFISLPPGVFSGNAIERLFLNQLTTQDDPRLACLADLRVSAHLLIRRRGEVVQFVGTELRAWHAGPSSMLGRERCNDFSIGIELEGDGAHRFTEAQYRRLAQVIGLLRARHPLRWIAGHEDVAPGRKQDPGPFFDWTRVLSSPDATGLVRPF
ncbi:MAG: 1,6-anhydro-N-acetylmuramyl-L-alanine amidase AmpD [Betaproteobacteria bacterium]|nr:1,6-anhydro-N-acetylmuramyl-L-alanine amidase AmpD [Betaproteobacteria bacterium]